MVNFGSDMLILLGEKFGVIFEGEDYLRREKCEGQICLNIDVKYFSRQSFRGFEFIFQFGLLLRYFFYLVISIFIYCLYEIYLFLFMFFFLQFVFLIFEEDKFVVIQSSEEEGEVEKEEEEKDDKEKENELKMCEEIVLFLNIQNLIDGFQFQSSNLSSFNNSQEIVNSIYIQN